VLLIYIVVSALFVKIAERAWSSAFTHRSDMYDRSEPLSKSTRQVVRDP